MLRVTNLSRRGTDLFPLQRATLGGQIWPARESSCLSGHCTQGQGILPVLLGVHVISLMLLSLTNIINSGRGLVGAQLAAPALKCGLPERSGGTKCLGEAAPFQESGLPAPINGNDARCGAPRALPLFSCTWFRTGCHSFFYRVTCFPSQPFERRPSTCGCLFVVSLVIHTSEF